MTPARVLAVSLLLGGTALAADWPAWRGPSGNGHSSEKELPLTWGPKDHVRWKVALPGPGSSSPIVWGDRVFITQSLDKKGSRRAVMCFGRSDGKLLWQKETPYAENEPTHGTNPYCSATPVTDGQRVIASLGSAGLVCYDMDGKELWRHDLGKLYHIWGNASSPILYGDLAILWCGPGDRQFLLAVNKSTGETVWKRDVPGGKLGDKGDWIGSWSTPIVARVADHDELILGVPEKVKGFDPKTGHELWSCDGLGKLVYTSPVCSPDGIVVVFSGFYGPALAVRAGGKGDVTKTHRLWHQPQRNPQRIGSPVLVGRHVFLISEPGLAQCFELESGKQIWEKKRLGTTTWSSLVAAAGRLYIADDAGDIHVLKASPDYQVLVHNSLPGEKIQASPAVADGQIFIRSHKHLWCIGRKP
jgi:outer membrane protein assembly factor BamB